MVELSFADDFFNHMPSSYKTSWFASDDDERSGALFKAYLDISTLRFKVRKVWDNPHVDIKRAVCLQAFYILENKENTAHILNDKNGISSMSLQSFSVSQSQVVTIYREARVLLARHIVRAGRFR